MNEVTVLNLTNIVLGLGVLTLWVVVGRSIVQELADRRRRRKQGEHPHLRLVAPPEKAA